MNDINENEYLEQLEYLKKYYGSEFKKNQGTEYLLDIINENVIPGNLIDFGSGSNIYFWLLATNNINSVCCVDISKEAFYINQEIKDGHIYPKSYEYPLQKYDKKLIDVFHIPIEYKILDVLNNNLNIKNKFNNVTQFGLLGLCKTKEEYLKNLKKLWNCLAQNGSFIGANWLFSKKYSKEKGFSNEYLSTNMIKHLANNIGAKINYLNMIPIQNDENYDYMLIYSLTKIYDKSKT